MYLTIIGASPGESAIVQFDDGSVLTIDSCGREGKNYTIDNMNRLGIDFSAVKYNIITHFHDDHIKGVADLIAACPGSKVVIPDAWTKDVFRYFVASQSEEVNLSAVSVTREIERVFDFLGQHPMRLFAVSELTTLYPPPVFTGENKERLVVLTPRFARKTDFLIRLGEAIDGGTASAFDFCMSNKNSTSISCLVQAGDRYIYLGGDVENGPPHHDVRETHLSHLADVPAYDFVKLPHHGSVTSFCDELRKRIADDKTVVAVTPYPKGKKQLPNVDTATYLAGANNVYVLSGEIVKLSKSVRDQKHDFFNLEPIRSYRPGIIDYFDGEIDTISCKGLDDYLAWQDERRRTSK